MTSLLELGRLDYEPFRLLWHTIGTLMANKINLPGYRPKVLYMQRDKQSFFFAIHRLYPEVFENLAVNVFPSFRSAYEAYELDNENLHGFAEVSRGVEEWMCKHNLDAYDWTFRAANDVLNAWNQSVIEDSPTFERRDPAVAGVRYASPITPTDTAFTFQYSGFGVFDHAKVKADMTARFEHERDAYLNKIKRTYEDNGWLKDTHEPKRNRNFEIITHHIVGGLKASEIVEKLDPKGEHGDPNKDQLLAVVEKAIDTMKKRLKKLK